MKTKGRLLVGLMWLLGSFSMEANAQEAVKALIKKCENMESIEMSVIRKRDRNTGDVISNHISFKITSNPALAKEFQDAFQKELDSKNKANSEIVTMRGGKIVSALFKYGNSRYFFDVRDGGQGADITVIEHFGNEDDNNSNPGIFNYHRNSDNLELNPEQLSDLNPFLSMPDLDLNLHDFEYFENIFP
ncbi:MAG: DUF5024 domain-containing protein [Tannerella sp.]|jgi:hypothetical protein|nr:DUF5024 domain-containing protein [Tannerella sp.]